MKQSAGILLYRYKARKPEVFLVHPGGPFWKNKHLGAWSIPKGEFDDKESAFEAAKREFGEETGFTLEGKFTELKPVRQKGGKKVYAWALEADIDPKKINSNHFEMEWPPKSGKMSSFPEIDKADWFGIEKAKEMINSSQQDLIDQLMNLIE